MTVKNKYIKTRLTEEEYNNVLKLSKKVGLNISDLIRESLKSFELTYNILKNKGEKMKRPNVVEMDKNICKVYIPSYISEDPKMIPPDRIEAGREMRRILRLDRLENIYDRIIVHFEEGSTIYTMTLRYFIGLFVDSTTKLKTEEEFRKKYELTGDPYRLEVNDFHIESLYKYKDSYRKGE